MSDRLKDFLDDFWAIVNTNATSVFYASAGLLHLEVSSALAAAPSDSGKGAGMAPR